MRNSFSQFNPSACSKILEPSKNSREGWWRSGGGKGGGGEIQRCCFPRWGYELACRCEDKFWSSSLSPCNKHRITSSFYSLSYTHTTIFVQQTWSSYLRWLCWLFVSWLCPLVVFTVRKRSMTAGRPMSQDVIHREKVPYDRWGAENDPRRECTLKKAGESCSSDDHCCSYFCDHTGKCITIGWSDTMKGSLIMTLMYCSTFSDYIAKRITTG